MSPETAEDLAAIVACWASHQPMCRALAVVGSWARGDAGPASDLDLLILTTALDRFADTPDWLSGIGLGQAHYRVASAVRVQYGVAFSWHVELDPLDLLEFTFADISWAKRGPIDPGTRHVIMNGVKVMVDKDGLVAALREHLG